MLFFGGDTRRGDTPAPARSTNRQLRAFLDNQDGGFPSPDRDYINSSIDHRGK